MKRYLFPIWILVVLAALVLGIGSYVAAQESQGGQYGDRHGGGPGRPEGPPCVPGQVYSQLTDDQKAAVEAKIAELKDGGATMDSVCAVVKELIESYGIEMPTPPDSTRGHRGPGGPGGRGGHMGPPCVPCKVLAQLTEEQLAAVEAKMTELREAGARMDSACAVVKELIESYGIEVPAPSDSTSPPDKPPCMPCQVYLQLTEEQRAAVDAKIAELKDSGAATDSVCAAVRELLESYGIEVPPPPQGHNGPPCVTREVMSQLTKEQRKAVREKMREMRKSGATREEICTAVLELIKGYGIDTPQDSSSSGESQSESGKTLPAGTHVQVYPNPFNPVTQIYYAVDAGAKVKVQICSVTGQIVRTFDEGFKSPGTYGLTWDGREENGASASSGVYFCRVEVGSNVFMMRMILLK